jgi:hypothetical protein
VFKTSPGWFSTVMPYFVEIEANVWKCRKNKYILLVTHTHTHTYIYIYIYIYREREREICV